MGKLRRNLENDSGNKSKNLVPKKDVDPSEDFIGNIPDDVSAGQAELIESGEIDPDELPIVDIGLRDWFLKNNLENTEYRVTLYRYTNPNFGDRKTLVFQYTDEIPQEHEIGLKYGSGRYCLYVCLTDNKGKRRIYHSKFRLSEEYDKIKIDSALSSGPVVIGSGNPAGQMDAAFQMITKVMSMVLPIIQVNNQNRQEPLPNYTELMMESYKSMNEILKRNTLDNSQFLNDLQRRVSDVPEIVESESEVSGVTGFINSIAPLLEKFLPYLTGKSNTESKAVVGMLKGSSEYAQVIKDKNKVKALLKFIETKHGLDVREKIVKRLGISI